MKVLFADAHHVEVQVVGVPDDVGVQASALGDRDCSTQRSMQKLIEVAPAVWLPDQLRPLLHADAVALCAAVGLVGLATRRVPRVR